VGLDLAEFLRRQRAALLEHLVVDADLADVMQESRQIEVAPFGRGHVQLLGEPDRDPRHALRVPRGVRVLGVDAAHEGMQHAHEQVFEIVSLAFSNCVSICEATYCNARHVRRERTMSGVDRHQPAASRRRRRRLATTGTPGKWPAATSLRPARRFTLPGARRLRNPAASGRFPEYRRRSPTHARSRDQHDGGQQSDERITVVARA
jgi:hypothetical protein